MSHSLCAAAPFIDAGSTKYQITWPENADDVPCSHPKPPPDRVVVLRCLREVCADGQLLVDLFVNYDCDLNSSNLFERLVAGLVKAAQAPLPQGADHTAVQQEQWLRQEALQVRARAGSRCTEGARQPPAEMLCL